MSYTKLNQDQMHANGNIFVDKLFESRRLTLKSFDPGQNQAHRTPSPGMPSAAASGVAAGCSFMDDFFSALARLWCIACWQRML